MDLRRLLAERDLLADDVEAEVTPLAGGYWNQVARVRGDGFDWVAKVFAQAAGERLFPILPDDEARALQVLDGLGAAPAFVDYRPRVGELPAVLVYAWVDGGQWEEGAAEVALLFRRVHAVRPDGFREVATGSVGILEQAERLLAGADPADAAALRALRPERRVQPAARRSLIHADAGPGNIIVGADGPRLIDWQCPAIGDPAEDVFTFLSPSFQVLYGHEPLRSDERSDFLAAYDDPAVEGRLAALSPALAYRIAAYSAARRVELADADPAGAARYARALDLALAELAGGSP